ncbi:hypothetical protein LZ554_002262 [Drepanopeziza brunnea f. sp. 'monogermtubi']|nr:hypothetical protein LZ554_002262 [Drepanopeziza brunnea f. sp. 'monogermtubi']
MHRIIDTALKSFPSILKGRKIKSILFSTGLTDLDEQYVDAPLNVSLLPENWEIADKYETPMRLARVRRVRKELWKLETIVIERGRAVGK